MRTAVTETSISCYHDLNLTEQQKVVVGTIVLFEESCIADVATSLNWERSTVSGRMNDLKKLGLLVFTEKRKSKTTGINSEFYRVREFKKTFFE